MLSHFPYINIPAITGNPVCDTEALLRANHREKTLTHVTAVAGTLIPIAGRHGLHTRLCEQAAYLHDIAAVIKPEDMLAYCARHDLPLDEAEKLHPFLLHQRFSALIAEEDLHVSDLRVLSAVACHSTLKAEPSPYDLALFIADKLSWDQEGQPPFYDEMIRSMESTASLEAAALAYMEYIVKHGLIRYPHRWFEEGRRHMRVKAAMARINPEIAAYVREHIIPQYAGFDAAHGISHAEKVIANALSIAADYTVCIDQIYVAAAYHDLGLRHGRDRHETASRKIILTDEMLTRWFTGEEIQLMAEAAEDHRASRKEEPRSLYGRIVAEADRDIDYETILTRIVLYSLKNYPEYNYEQHLKRAYAHIREKYGEGGYLTLWLDTDINRRKLTELREAVREKERFEADFRRIFDSV